MKHVQFRWIVLCISGGIFGHGCGEISADADTDPTKGDDTETVLGDAGDTDSTGEQISDWDKVLHDGVAELFSLDDLDDGDITNETGGIWYTYDDGYDNGSSVIWPVSIFKGGVFETDTPGLGDTGRAAHITGTVGGDFAWPYLGLLAALDKDSLCPKAAPTKLDLNSFDGIQFVLKGTLSGGALVFKIPHKKSGPEDNCTAHDPISADSLTRYADYEINITEKLSAEWSLVRIPFESLVQLAWASESDIYTIEEVLTTAQELVWQVNASDGVETDFWVDNVALFKYPDSSGAYPKAVVSDVSALELSDDTDDPATADEATIEVADQPFATARRVTVDSEPTHLWDVMMYAKNETPIAARDVLSADFYARCAEPPDNGSECRFTIYFQMAEAPYTRSTVFPVRVGETWQHFSHPFSASIGYDTGAAAAALFLGYPAQTLEIADFSIQNFGDTKTEAELDNTPFTYDGRDTDAPWRAEAAERIEQYRKGDLTVSVVDAEGSPIPNAAVSVEMTRHRFGFGTAIDTDGLRYTFSDADIETYTDKVSMLFNTVVFENTLKWVALEGEWGDMLGADTAAWGLDWAENLDLDTRGHVLVWPGWTNLPASLKSDYDTSLAADGAEVAESLLRETVETHVQSTVSSFAGRLTHWDVLNEPFDNHDLMDILGRDAMVDWFQIARDEDPAAALFINDYSILAPITTFSASRKNLFDTVSYLVEQDAPIDGIGLQAHFQGDLTDPERVLEILDEAAAYNKQIWITEFDIANATNELAADYTRDFLTVLFSHPAVEGFVMWGFWDGAHFGGPAPLFEKDWTEKPAFAAYRDLVLTQWHTQDAGAADADGRFETRAFFGTYDITVTANGLETSETADFSPETSVVSVVLD